MARNNRARTKVKSPPPPKSENLFTFVTPTDFAEIPSEGKFYPTEHPLHGEDVVEIKFMTAKEEDLLTSQALISKGVVIDRLIESVLIEDGIESESLLLGDKNALIVAIRITGYGTDYKTNITCPGCSVTSPYTFDLESLEFKTLVQTDDAIETGNGTYLISGLPQTGAEVEVKFLTGRDEKNLASKLASNKKHNLGLAPLMEQTKSYIISVNGNTGENYINSFLENMPTRDARHLRTTYGGLVPDINMSHEYVCEECRHETILEVPLTADFFWPQ